MISISGATASISADAILQTAIEVMTARAASRDQPDGERSMQRAVAAFTALTGLAMTEVQGWQFMAVLKLARAQGGSFNLDDYVDGAAYLALAGECEIRRAEASS